MTDPRPVVFVPGVVTPVEHSYAPLLTQLGESIRPILKELEVYATDEPPRDYSIALEVEALRAVIDSEGLDRAHIVAFSGGGAVSLSFAARYPDRLASLAMFEPANVPGVLDEYERAFDEHVRSTLRDLPPEQVLQAFTLLHLRPGVEPPSPPPGPEPEWMAKRPAGIDAMTKAFQNDVADRDALRNCRFPVYLAYGLLTGEYMVHRVQVLAALLPDVWIEAYPGIHHFGPPQRTQPARYAHSLRTLWSRADAEMNDHGSGDTGYAA
jgi:pimeloyl-ACP methyl ester carboxylesterase